MSDRNEQKPAGYGHDKKGAAGGTAKNEGRVHVAHKAPMQGVADRGDKATAETLRPRGRHPRGRDHFPRRAA